MHGRFEQYVARMLFSIPLPSRLHPVTLELHLPGRTVGAHNSTTEHDTISLSLPGRSELPPIDLTALEILFRKLKAKTITRCLKYLLLEERIIMLGEKRDEIVACCNSLRTLLYPFKYDNCGNWFVSYISLRDYSSADWFCPALIGLDK